MTTGTGLPGVDRTTFVKSRVGMDYANPYPEILYLEISESTWTYY
jgi:hypothetical protein